MEAGDMNHQPLTGPPGTRIYSDGHHLIVDFRDQTIVKVNYVEITLNTGGTKDTIVQNRLNQTARLLHLDYHINRTASQTE
jgi:hypothetical protein